MFPLCSRWCSPRGGGAALFDIVNPCYQALSGALAGARALDPSPRLAACRLAASAPGDAGSPNKIRVGLFLIPKAFSALRPFAHGLLPRLEPGAVAVPRIPPAAVVVIGVGIEAEAGSRRADPEPVAVVSARVIAVIDDAVGARVVAIRGIAVVVGRALRHCNR